MLNVCSEFVTTDTLLAVIDSDAGQTVTWSLISAPAHGAATATYTATSMGGLLTPTGLSYTPVLGYYGPDTFRVRVADGVQSDTTTICIMVMAPPHVGAIVGPSSVCVGATIVLADTPLGGTWAASSGIASVVGGTVTGISAGTVTIDYFVTNLCGTVFAAQTLTVDSFPIPGVISGPAAVCIGDSITLSASAGGGTWQSATGLTTAFGDGTIRGVLAGADTIRYTITNACGAITTSHAVAALPMPDAGVIAGDDTLCVGEITTLTATTPGGVWRSANTAIATVGAGGLVAALLPGADTIFYTVSNAACSAVAAMPVYIRSASACPTGLADAGSGIHGLSIYPNPNSGSFMVLLSSAITTEAQITITNILGIKVMEVKAYANEPIPMLLAQPAGIYFITVSAEGGVWKKKVIVAR